MMGKTKIQGSYQENTEFFNIFFILADLTWHRIRGFSIVDNEYLNFFTSQHATKTDFISCYFLLHQEATTPRRTYLLLLQSLTTRYPKGLQVDAFYYTYPFDSLSFHKRLFLYMQYCCLVLSGALCTLSFLSGSSGRYKGIYHNPQEILPVAHSSSSVKHHYSDTILRGIRKSFVYLPSKHILIWFFRQDVTKSITRFIYQQ